MDDLEEFALRSDCTSSETTPACGWAGGTVSDLQGCADAGKLETALPLSP
jgi:hypothetical protein